MSEATLTKDQRKALVKKAADQAVKEVVEAISAEPVKVDDGKLFAKNTKGEMLMCELTIHKRQDAADPLCVTINEEFRWIKRGAPCIVPWYVVAHLGLNIETKYRQEKDQQGRRITVSEDMVGEPFSFREIDPDPNNPRWYATVGQPLHPAE